MPFPHTDFPANLFVPADADPSGPRTVSFWWHPLTYQRHARLGESGERGLVETIELSVNWQDYQAFETTALGFSSVNDGGDGTPGDPDGSTANGWNLRRLLPLRSPVRAAYSSTRLSPGYLTDLVVVNKSDPSPLLPSGASPPDTLPPTFDPTLDHRFRFDWVTVRAEFESRSYNLVADADVPAGVTAGPVKELGRYVTRQPLPTVRERVISGNQFEAVADPTSSAAGKPIGEPVFVTDRQGTIQYTFHQVPFRGIPWEGISKCQGKVNDALFDPWDYSLNPDGMDVPAERLLFQGLAESPVAYRGPNGEKYADLKYLFRWRPSGDLAGGTPDNPNWNQYAFWDKVTSTLRVWYLRWRGVALPSRHPYLKADFNRLFRAE